MFHITGRTALHRGTRLHDERCPQFPSARYPRLRGETTIIADVIAGSASMSVLTSVRPGVWYERSPELPRSRCMYIYVYVARFCSVNDRTEAGSPVRDTHTCIYMYIYTSHINIHIQIHVCTCRHTCPSLQDRTEAGSPVRDTHINIHIHTCTCACFFLSSFSSLI